MKFNVITVLRSKPLLFVFCDVPAFLLGERDQVFQQLLVNFLNNCFMLFLSEHSKMRAERSLLVL